MARVFSAIRPSGKIHLGNYLGAIKSWIELQEKHECIYAVADYHGITTPFKPQELKENIFNLVLDYLALGVNPEKSILIIQSQIPEHLELAWIFSTLTPVSWLQRMPTYKEKAAEHPQYVNLGLLAYPALMAADILIYKSELVPIGEDQLPHLEYTNEIARRFNKIFGETFPKVEPFLSQGARIMSLKNPKKKMSKTGDEGIAISDSPEEIRRKIKAAITDSGHEIVFREDKPALANLLTIYSEVSGLPIPELEKKYRNKGYAEFKRDLAEVIIKFLKPIQNKREKLKREKGYLEKIIKQGVEKAKFLAQTTLKEVKERIGLIF